MAERAVIVCWRYPADQRLKFEFVAIREYSRKQSQGGGSMRYLMKRVLMLVFTSFLVLAFLVLPSDAGYSDNGSSAVHT
jgi:hypothetical protein